MYIALDKEQKRISIKDAVQGDVFFCPVWLKTIASTSYCFNGI